jgi:hypothetical protein
MNQLARCPLNISHARLLSVKVNKKLSVLYLHWFWLVTLRICISLINAIFNTIDGRYGINKVQDQKFQVSF